MRGGREVANKNHIFLKCFKVIRTTNCISSWSELFLVVKTVSTIADYRPIAVLIGVILKRFQKSFHTSCLLCYQNEANICIHYRKFHLFFFLINIIGEHWKQSLLCRSCSLFLIRLESELWVSKAETLFLHRRMVWPFESTTLPILTFPRDRVPHFVLFLPSGA